MSKCKDEPIMSDAEAAQWFKRMGSNSHMRQETMTLLGTLLFADQQERVARDQRFALAEVACKVYVAATKAQDQALKLAEVLLSDEYEAIPDEEVARIADVYAGGIKLGGPTDPDATQFEYVAVRKRS